MTLFPLVMLFLYICFVLCINKRNLLIICMLMFLCVF